jgi:NADPH2:quinone reductase
MRAWRVTGRGEPRNVLSLVSDAAVPEAGPGQVRLRVAAAGVGLPDVLMCRGRYALTPPEPFTPGQEATALEPPAGPAATVSVGERVMTVTGFFLGHGGFADECLAVSDFALPVPDAMDDAEAACFVIPFHTAWVGLVRRAALERGETLLVLGAAGGSGSAALQLGKALGAEVIAAARGADKGAFCLELGADRVVDPTGEALAEAVREATDGRGADVVYDPVGGTAFEEATRCIAHEGRLLAVGFASGRWGRPDPGHLVTHNYSVLGVMPGGYDRRFKENAHGALVEHWRAGRLRIPVAQRFPFESVPEALGRVAAGGVLGKIAVTAR